MSVVSRSRVGLQIAVLTEVDEPLADALWDLYVTCFDDLQHRAAARQLVSRADFALEVLDPRVTKIVATKADGTVVGLATVTTALHTVPWISPAFYAARFPEHYERSTIFYCPVMMVHPAARASRAFPLLLAELGRIVAAGDGILAADMCRFNVDEVELPKAVTKMLSRAHGGATCTRIDTQHYLAWELGRPAGEGREIGPSSRA